ncbi:HNH/ENDO VII family nuclease [Mycolicibacterium smegmatis]|uniref:GH-E family nuclease n=2 Tax=Mycolicibacterium smegmatis TaxID=1772 RepID=UPI001E5976C2|nr:GH-E family nuclease [Mycolicibacterium smegmatis]UGU29090.1 HNH/ENDO VII family nuclease [Mycolicibacterium smegmatis]
MALTVGGLHLLAPLPPSGADEAARTVSAAQGFADAAIAAFTDSAVGSDPTLTAPARRAGLPDDPVAGLTSPTPAGPVQVVLPGGLGNAQHTAGGQVVYPNAGAGFDLLAENTGSGTRTVARISDPGGPRMVTTFVRTPADTVMLAHTNGYLTINKATPTAETIGMFSPAETRDATGALVPSSYVVKQLAPQLYVLAEVIDPQPHTTWPVYADPPLHLTGPGGVPVGLFDSFTNTVSSLADTATSAVTTVASATVSGAKAVGGFVKENPLESALLVGGVALAVTGVGGPAGAAMIASATVNISSAAVDIAAAAMPDNQTLGIASTVLGAASMVTPQGAAKKAVKEGAELAAEQLGKHADDVIDVAKTTPTPPAQLADEVAAAGTPKPPVTPGVSPKAPNAPPVKAADSSPNAIPGGEQSWAMAPAPNDRRLSTDITSRVPLRKGTKQQVRDTHPFHDSDGTPLDPHTFERIEGTPHFGHKPEFKDETSRKMTEKYGLSRRERVEWENVPDHYQLEKPLENSGHKHEIPYRPGDEDKLYDKFVDWSRKEIHTNPRLAKDPTAQRRASLARPTGPDQKRQVQHVRAEQTTNRVRDTARDSARDANQSRSRSGSDSGSKSSGKSSDKKSDKKKDKKSKKHHKKPSGK